MIAKFLLIALALGVVSPPADPAVRRAWFRARVALALDAGGTLVLPEPAPQPAPDVVPEPVPVPTPGKQTCNICAGSQKSGDGIGPCPCFSDGRVCGCARAQAPAAVKQDPPKAVVAPKPIAAAAPSRQCLLFSGSRCPPCRWQELNALPNLRRKGWRAGQNANDHFRIFKDDEQADARYGVTSYPTLILLENGVEVARQTGRMDSVEMGKFYYQQTTRTQSAPVQAQPQPAKTQSNWSVPYPPVAYYHPGNIRDHLRRNHGWTQAELNRVRNDQYLENWHAYRHLQEIGDPRGRTFRKP